MHNRIRGVTVMELLITLFVIVGLGAMALPAYINFKHRLYYSEIVKAAAPYQEAINACYVSLKKMAGCNGGTNNIPANITKPKGPVASLTVQDGVISLSPVASKQAQPEDNLVYTPTVVNKEIKWAATGKAIEKGYVN